MPTNKAIKFDGVNDYCQSKEALIRSLSYRANQTGSFDYWVKLGSDAVGSAICHGGLSAQYGYMGRFAYIRVHHSVSSGTVTTQILLLRENSRYYTLTFTHGWVDEFIHIAVTMSSSSPYYRVYLNGVLQSPVFYKSPDYNSEYGTNYRLWFYEIQQNTNRATLGVRWFQSNFAEYSNATIGATRVWTPVLSGADITLLSAQENYGKRPSEIPGVVAVDSNIAAEWLFTDLTNDSINTVDSIVDTTGHDNHLTGFNFTGTPLSGVVDGFPVFTSLSFDYIQSAILNKTNKVILNLGTDYPRLASVHGITMYTAKGVLVSTRASVPVFAIGSLFPGVYYFKYPFPSTDYTPNSLYIAEVDIDGADVYKVPITVTVGNLHNPWRP